jgi:hypothetical protein
LPEKANWMNAEKAVGEQIARAAGETVSKLGLRFDRVVVRVLRDLRGFAKTRVPTGKTVILTLTAPILTPTRTVAALQPEIDTLLRSGTRDGDRIASVCGNAIRIRVAKHMSSRNHELIGLVHNRDIDSKHLADLVESWLRGEA